MSLGAARRRDASLGLNMAAALRGGREVSGTPVEVSEGRDRGRLPRGVVVGTGGGGFGRPCPGAAWRAAGPPSPR